MRTTAILVAAGQGRRIGGDVSKTYLPIAGRPLFLRALDRLFSTPAIHDVILVIAPDDFARCETFLRGDLIFQIVLGLYRAAARHVNSRFSEVWRGFLRILRSS